MAVLTERKPRHRPYGSDVSHYWTQAAGGSSGSGLAQVPAFGRSRACTGGLLMRGFWVRILPGVLSSGTARFSLDNLQLL